MLDRQMRAGHVMPLDDSFTQIITDTPGSPTMRSPQKRGRPSPLKPAAACNRLARCVALSPARILTRLRACSSYLTDLLEEIRMGTDELRSSFMFRQ